MMKRYIWIVMVLLILCMNTCVAESSVTVENLIDDWTEKYVKNSEECSTGNCANEDDTYISKREALSTAVHSIVLLSLESPTSLYESYSIQFDFYRNDETNRIAWNVQFFERNSHSYTLRVDAITGELCAILVFNSANLPDSFFEEEPYLDKIIDEWYILYSHSPNFSPEVYAAELKNSELPDECGVHQREALRCALQVLKSLGSEVENMCAYMPFVHYDVSPIANRWDISLKGGNGTVSFTINADTGVMENMGWVHRQDNMVFYAPTFENVITNAEK